MSYRSKQRSQRRMRIVMAVFAILVVLSMLASTVSVFAPVSTSGNPSATQPRPQPTTVLITPAP